MAFANQEWYSLTGFPTDADSESPGWWAPIVYPDDINLAFQSFSKLQDHEQAVSFEIRLAKESKHFSHPITWVLGKHFLLVAKTVKNGEGVYSDRVVEASVKAHVQMYHSFTLIFDNQLFNSKEHYLLIISRP